MKLSTHNVSMFGYGKGEMIMGGFAFSISHQHSVFCIQIVYGREMVLLMA